MKVDIQNRKWVLNSFIKVEAVKLRFERFDGSMSAEVERMHIDRGEASGALIYNRTRNTFVFVEQFRFAAWTKNEGWLAEIPTGKIDKGENPEEAVRREVLEETGYKLNEVIFISRCYPSPGGSSENYHLYFAEVDDTMLVGDGGGLHDENEDIRIKEYPISEIDALMSENLDAKSIITLQWWKINRA